MKESAYKKYLLAVLLAILAFNFVDRLALGLVLQDIKLEFHLSDTQLGFLSGLAFALFYSVMGIPIARWADGGNRVTIITTTTALWSVAMMLCGAAGNFVQLLLIRVGVAVGEAGCVPPAHSLIADHFNRIERPRAVSIYMLGSPLSVVGGYFLAGWLNELFGWRAMFMWLALPGVLLAALAGLTLREPRRLKQKTERAHYGSTSGMKPPEPPSLKQVCVVLWASRTFRHLLLSFSVTYFFGYGILQWQPAFFVRSYELQSAELGAWFAVIYGLGGLLGTYAGGVFASRFAAGNERLQLRAMAVAYCCFAATTSGTYLSSNLYLALGLLGLATVGVASANGPLFATIQTLVPERMRAVSIASIYLFANLVGMGLGPLVAGALSDWFRPWAGNESLRYALLSLCPGYLWAAWHLWCAGRTVANDLNASNLPESLTDGASLDALSANSHPQKLQRTCP
jgi:MFS family permease